MSRSLENILRDTLAACERLLTLARGGDDASDDTASRILFGRMRDAAYELRALASRHLTPGSAPEEGTTPAVRPPCVVRDCPTAGATPEPSAPARGRPHTARKVVIVDDDPDVVTGLACWFEDRGFVAHAAFDGVEGWRLIETERPDLITLDVRMPGESGVTVLNRLKRDADLGRIPVIVITGTSDALSADGGGIAAAPLPEGFLAKPFELYDLASLVRALVA